MQTVFPSWHEALPKLPGIVLSSVLWPLSLAEPKKVGTWKPDLLKQIPAMPLANYMILGKLLISVFVLSLQNADANCSYFIEFLKVLNELIHINYLKQSLEQN